jgi:hypothetical protein
MHANLKNIHKIFFDIKNQLHKNPLVKFSAVLLILLIYMFFSIKHFGAKDGFIISILTWTFFVLCTPVADAGFLLDFPIRVLTGLKMIYSEIIVWSIAITTNIIIFFSHNVIYESTKLLSLFHHILSQPFPFWLIIILSAGGTFLSLLFGDELMDISYEHKKDKEHHKKHKHKHHLIIIITIFIIIIAIYDFLLNKLGVKIPLLH